MDGRLQDKTSSPSSDPNARSPSSASTRSDSSAAERLNWRSHPPLISPKPGLGHERDPFEDLYRASDSGVDGRDGGINKRHGGEAGGAGIPADAKEKKELGGNEGASEEEGGAKEKNLSWRDRIRHFTWTWFTMTMATGGLANVINSVPFRFHGLYEIGCMFFLLNIVLFFFNIGMISWRFYLYPKTFKASFQHPTESLFIPAAVISFGTILINISQYGVPKAGLWLQHGMWVLYWFYCGLAIAFSCGIYLVMWSTQTFTISQMTPIWIFPAYPLLIVGPHAGNLALKLPNEDALSIIISGWIMQGIGFMVSLMIYSAFLYRLMTQKLPKESLRPGMFISVGPSGFTIAGIISMGRLLPKVVPPDFMGEGNGEFAARVSAIVANWVGLWLWGLALWFFFISVGAHWSCAARGKLDFAMTWYSFVFPNTALTTATFAVAQALGANRPLQYIGCVMTAGLVATWLFVFIMMVRAVYLKQILWPQKQEDRSEGGWKQPKIEDERRKGWAIPPIGANDPESALNRGWSLRRTWTSRDRLGESRRTGRTRERYGMEVPENRVRKWSFGRSVSRRR